MKGKELVLPLKAQWYNMIESGEKKEEYREIKPYWQKRLDGKEFDTVTFTYGYTKRRMTCKCNGIRKDTGNPKWGAVSGVVYYVISLGERIL